MDAGGHAAGAGDETATEYGGGGYDGTSVSVLYSDIVRCFSMLERMCGGVVVDGDVCLRGLVHRKLQRLAL